MSFDTIEYTVTVKSSAKPFAVEEKTSFSSSNTNRKKGMCVVGFISPVCLAPLS